MTDGSNSSSASSGSGSRGSRGTGRSGSGHPMLSGFLMGLVTGLGIAAMVAVWVARMPSPFQNRALSSGDDRNGAGAAPATGVSAAAGSGAGGQGAVLAGPGSAGLPAAADRTPAGAGAPAPAPLAVTGDRAASSTPGALGGAPGAAGAAPSTATASNVPVPPSAASPAASSAAGTGALSSTGAYVQAGAFDAEDKAQRQVEAVALATGLHAQSVALQHGDRVLYHVRLGPFQRKAELQDVMDTLKANGIAASLVRAGG